MKKVIISDEIYQLIEKEKSPFNRSDIKILRSSSNTEALNIHKTEDCNLIITGLDSPDISGEELCSVIRGDKKLCKVSVIIICSDDKVKIERCLACRANAFITKPVKMPILMDSAIKLLDIYQREVFRAPLGVKVEGRYKNLSFLCFSENISASGMLFESEKMLERGDLIMCSFFFPNSRRVTVRAEVVRIAEKQAEFDSNRYGIKFINLSNEYKSIIEDFVKEQTKG